VLCLKRNVTGQDEAWALGKEFVAVLQKHELPRMDGRAGAAFCIYWSEVSEDSEPPLEWCRPVPGDRARDLADQVPELSLRTEPADLEAVVHLGPGGQTSPAMAARIGVTPRLGAGQQSHAERSRSETHLPGQPPGDRDQRT
jgi:hypothetical protein